MNVIEAALKRIEFAFNNSDYVCCSFSGGKDSGVMLNLAINYAKDNNLINKFCIFHIDYEAQYQQTTDFVNETMQEAIVCGIKIYHFCLPLKTPCATSMHQNHWKPWDEDKKNLWVRQPPNWAILDVKDKNLFYEGIWDYDFQESFGEHLRKTKNINTVTCLVGIRSEESLNRWRAINRSDRVDMLHNKPWSKKVSDGVYNIYPIHDWKLEDVWHANYQFNFKYNKLYDLLYLSGIPPHKMRVASPFNNYAQESLKYYRVIDPQTWGKMVSRVNGVNFTGIYGGTTAMGWKKITKPEHFTWKEYLDFLLNTLPEPIKLNYIQRFNTSIDFWKKRGGVLSEQTIKEIESSNIKIQKKPDTSYNTGKESIVFYEYPDSIDTVYDFKSVPSYKRMCVCILKNDHFCKYMGFSITKQQVNNRKKILMKYKGL